MFETRYETWMNEQRKTRKGESLRRLIEGHGHNEKLFAEEIWYPAVGSFEYLHAEYEVRSHWGGSFFLDYGYVRRPYLLEWEIDDFSSHAKNMTRKDFMYERLRQNQLVFDDWKVFRIPLDMIKERPEQCRQFVLQVIGKFYGNAEQARSDLSLKHREIMRLALRLQRPFAPIEVCVQLGICNRSARELLQQLVRLELLEGAGGHERVRSYRLTSRGAHLYLA